MANMDRFGGVEAADAYFTALDEMRERQLRTELCEDCAKYHAAPIPTRLGWCDECEDFVYGDLTPFEAGCDEYE